MLNKLTEQLQAELTKRDIQIQVQWNTGREYIRIDDQYLNATYIEKNGKIFAEARFGKWRVNGDKAVLWSSDKAGLSEEEIAAFKELSKQMEENSRKEKERRDLEGKERAKEVWAGASDKLIHYDYLHNNKIVGLHGARAGVDGKGKFSLLIPLHDIEGELWNVQSIYNEKVDGTNKWFPPGRIRGLFHTIGKLDPDKSVYLCEGFRTGAAIHQALQDKCVIVTLNAYNLPRVAGLLKQKYPNLNIIVCGDNDQWTRLKNGTLKNVGKDKAKEAAYSVNGTYVLPKFKQDQLQKKPNDFHDLLMLENLDTVAYQINNPTLRPLAIEPLPTRVSKQGKVQKFTQKEICDHLLDHFQDKIVVVVEDIFIYTGTHWKLQSKDEKKRIKQLISTLAGSLFTYSDIQNTYNYFLTHAPSTPPGINLFQPNPFAANFSNGTLFLDRGQDGKYTKTFRKGHSPDDWLTAVLPFEYSEEKRENKPFLAVLNRVWEGDVDQQDKIRLYKQVLGACFMPAFPIIVLFVGAPKTGKSTLIKLAMHLVHEENWCSVDPCQFKSFNMQNMIGKLLNLHTDISTVTPWEDTVAKRIIDRLPIEIDRKHEKTATAYLPSVHLFGANSLPRTLDGASRAYDRRVIIIKTDKFQPVGNYDKEFDQWVWEQSPEGIISAALDGLNDLIESNGHYHVPLSGRELVERMQDASDPVAMFLSDIKEGLVSDKNNIVSHGKEYVITRSAAWELFSNWKMTEDRGSQAMGKGQFFAGLERKKYLIKKKYGIWKISGFGVEINPNSDF